MTQKRKSNKPATARKPSKAQKKSYVGSLFIIGGFLFVVALAIASMLVFQRSTPTEVKQPAPVKLTEQQARSKALSASPSNKPHPINLGDIAVGDTILEDGYENERETLPPSVSVDPDVNEEKTVTAPDDRPVDKDVSPKAYVTEVEPKAAKPEIELTQEEITPSNAPQISALPPAEEKLPEQEPMIEWLRPDTPMIAIVLDDVGVNKKGAELAIELPGAITLAFMTYASGVREMTQKATDKGHELMLHVPMEPLGKADPGPKALLMGLSEEEILTRLEWGMAQFDGYIGINNHMGSKFTGWRKGMEVVMSRIGKTDYFFMDSRTSPNSVAALTASTMGVPVLKRDVFLDNDYKNKDKILKQLKQAERIAKKNGHAIAIGHPHQSTVEVLHKWIKDVESRGFQVVPISEILALKKPAE